MKRTPKFLIVVVLALSMVMLVTITALAAGPARASGSAGLVDGRTFSFTAVEGPNGATGQGTLISGSRFHFAVDCLNVDGNTATISGYLTSTNFEFADPGAAFWFRVEDNGQGANAAPDRSTFFYFDDNTGGDPLGADCTQDLADAELFELIRGNVTVK